MREAADILMQSAPAAVYIMTFVFGMVTGSFLNVCICRLPRHESVVSVPSHCMTCGKKLKPYELVPLFSYLFLKGRCSGCGTRISPQYPLIEAANGLLWLSVLAVKGLTVEMLLCQLLLSALLVVSVIDVRTREIPFPVVVFIFLLAAVKLGFYHTAWLDNLLGFVIMGGLFALILLLSGGKAMGGGDVKLVFACSLFVGLKSSLLAVFIACAAGSVIHLSLMKLKNLGRSLAFGPYLSFGYAFAALWGEALVRLYLSYFIR